MPRVPFCRSMPLVIRAFARSAAIISTGLVVLACVLLPDSRLLAAEPRALNFELDIAPILEARCNHCHGATAKKGGLDLRRRFAILAGGDGGPGIVVGKPDESLLIEKIRAKEMPPKEEDPLDQKQIDLITRWVAAGAPTQAEKERPLETEESDGQVTAADRSFWSFRPPVRSTVPVVQHADQVLTPIDAFLLAKLEEKGLSFNPEAGREVLLRRLCFDLTGLPPTVEQIDQFVNDADPQAYERLVDRLLASSQYGEHWGRHWLDVAGYADSDGYLEADRERPEAWRYRDYVIRALNRDLSYDQFIREQLAGDELTDWRRSSELSPETIEQLVATGFLRTAPDPTYAGYKESPEIHKVLADTMQIVGSAFLGVTIQCARCHEHKSEPISQRDYYQLLAVLTAAYDPDPKAWLASGERGIVLATEAQRKQVESRNQQVAQRIAQLEAEKKSLILDYKQRLANRLLSSVGQPVQEQFRQPLNDSDWTVQLAGTATAYQLQSAGAQWTVSQIEGKAGYALVRITRPVWLTGDIDAELNFTWQSQDTAPDKSTAMQGLLLNLRDASGQLIASAGYIDENIDKRGSPILGLDGGDDLVATNTKKLQQAVPNSEQNHKLPASGTGTVRLTRRADGQWTGTFSGGGIEQSLAPQEMAEAVAGGVKSARPVAQIELEFRRYVHAGATYEGIAVQQLTVKGNSVPLEPVARDAVLAALIKPADQLTAEQKQQLEKVSPRVSISDAELTTRYPDLQTELTQLAAAVQSEQALKRTLLQVRGLIDQGEQPKPTHVLRRGDFNTPGKEVQPGVPAVLTAAEFRFEPKAGYQTTGRRAALANWLISPQQPTTARVQINRLWAAHFGRGLVESLDDFGHLGKPPSHPELLDWLAVEFRERGWSQKAMHKLMVLSRAYRQSSHWSDKQAAIDSDNVLLSAWRPRRHRGEMVRDALLAVSGKLNPTAFGPPVPVQLQGDGSVLTPEDSASQRRSIYLKVRRSQPVTLLDAFDTPRMEINCTQRSEATVPSQALVMLNSPQVTTLSGQVAERILAARSDEPSRVEYAWKLILGRAPVSAERERVSQFLATAIAAQKESSAAGTTELSLEKTAWQQLALTLLNCNEFLFVE